MICFAKPHKNQKALILEKSQNGAVLIVSLVMLTILTIIAIGTISDTNLQSNMARNNQISLNAFNLALSELKAQFQSSKDNGQIDGMNYQQKLSDIYQTETPHEILPADMLMASPDNKFTQTGSISFIREGICGGGNEIGNSALIYEVNSTSRLDNTGINSDQSFGICYPNPNSD